MGVSLHTSDEVTEAVDNLRQLNQYAFSLLKQTENKLFQSPLGKQAYLLALYISSIAQVQGIVCLADNKQYRVSMNQVRTMFEICVNMGFIYSHPSDVFTYYLVIKSEQEKLARLRILHTKGEVKDDELCQFEKRLKLYEGTLAKEYPSWPYKIPEVFGKLGKNTPSTLERINLKQKCQIVDFYNAKTESTTLTDIYDGLYPFFSDGAHGELLELTMAFDETEDNVHVDVDGSKDTDRMYGFARTVFAWHYSSIKRVKEEIIKPTSLVMPAWLRMMAKDLGIDQ